MNPYNFVFVWVAVMSLFSTQSSVYHRTDICGEQVYRWKFFPALIAFFPVIYLAAFTPARYDTVLYLLVYQAFPTNINSMLFLLLTESEKGWVLFQWFVKVISGGSVLFFRIVLVSIHCIPVLFFLRKYSGNFILSLYLFLATSCHLAWMMNGIRQYLAVSIILLSVPFILKNKLLVPILLILLASTFHTSALMMIPIVFIARGKPWNFRTCLFIVAIVILTVLFSKDDQLMDSMLSNTTYSGSMEYAISIGDDGVHPLRVVISSIPALMAFLGRKKIERDQNPLIDLSVNMSVITACLYLVAMVTSGILVGRLPIYTSLFNFVLLPYLVKRLFVGSSRTLVSIAMVGLYFVYYLFESGVL